jgi:hypothetical protein
MRVEERLRQAYQRTRSSGPAEAGVYDQVVLWDLATACFAHASRLVVRPSQPDVPSSTAAS